MALTLEQRLQELEDREAIRQVVCGYGYAVDGCNADAVGSFYVEDGVYSVGDIGETPVLAAAVTGQNPPSPGVRGFVRNWRARQDSNLLPQD